jgi:Lipopolysaccharide kinase (Kdo/WaaP) family
LTRDTLWQRLFQGVRRSSQRADWDLFAGPNWIDRIMQVAVTDRFHAKQGRSTGRWIVENGHGRLAVYLKRHYRLPRWRGLAAALLPGRGWSPALEEWRHLEWARSQGLPVPATVAAAEYIGPWGRLQSFLAVEELAGMLPLHEAIPQAALLLAPEEFQRWKRTLAAEVARLARLLHDCRHFHRDLYLCHFYIATADLRTVPDWRGAVHLIDLHRLRHHRFLWRIWQVKDLAQLRYSSETKGVDDLDRRCFWNAYLGDQRRQWIVWFLQIGVWLKAGRYRRHNARKRKRVSGETPVTTHHSPLTTHSPGSTHAPEHCPLL